jgi:hypothetical protein
VVRDPIGEKSDAYRKKLRIRDFRIWHADQIRTMLDAHQDIRWAFPGLLTAGDVLAALMAERLQLGSLGLDEPLRRDVIKGLMADRWIRLSQAGGGGDKLWLDEVIVDVPATIDDDGADERTVRPVQHVLDRSDAVLRPGSLIASAPPGWF